MKALAKVLAAALCVPALLAAATVAATWAPDRPLSELKARWARPPSSFVRVQGMNVHLRDEGPRADPVPIVLPPGDAEKFHRDIAGSRLIVFDQLGHVPQEEDPAASVAAAKQFLF